MHRARMYDPLFTTPSVAKLLADREFFRCMLRVEVALAKALEHTGEIPAGCAQALKAIDIESLDLGRIAAEGASSGNVCIPFVKALTETIRAENPEAAGYVHWGATSQDVIDTALLLQLRPVWDMLLDGLDAICSALATRADELRHAVMAGRTWLQQGPPVTLGLKMATWLDALLRDRERMLEARERVFALQFGGAVGTLAALGQSGVAVTTELAKEVGLGVADIPWHTQRDRMGEIATVLGILAGTLGKIGRDVSLLMQTEVGEFLEPVGKEKGGSSTMPHKRNPVGCAVILAASVRIPGLVSTVLSAMVQEHERGLGGWQAEWETIPEIARLAAGSLSAALEIVRDGRVEMSAMTQNLDRLHGVPMAEAAAFLLARKIGKAAAHRVLEQASQRALAKGTSLLEELAQQPEVVQQCSREELARALDPREYLGATDAFIDAVIERNGRRRSYAAH